MKTIWKYKLRLTDTQSIAMPRASWVLCAQVQDGCICLWVIVYPDEPKVLREFEIIGTGNPVHDADRNYISTVQDGGFVWHVFERNKPTT